MGVRILTFEFFNFTIPSSDLVGLVGCLVRSYLYIERRQFSLLGLGGGGGGGGWGGVICPQFYGLVFNNHQ